MTFNEIKHIWDSDLFRINNSFQWHDTFITTKTSVSKMKLSSLPRRSKNILEGASSTVRVSVYQKGDDIWGEPQA